MAGWMVSVPVQELARLENVLKELDGLRDENRRLEAQLMALRQMFTDLMEQFIELKKELHC